MLRLLILLALIPGAFALQSDKTNGYKPTVDKDGNTVPAVKGVWRTRGYGYVAEVKDNSVRFYNETKVGTVAEEEDDDSDELFYKPGPRENTLWITFHPSVPGYLIERLDKLPAACTAKVDWTQPKIFEYFCATMTEQYAFFKERNIDWPALVKSHRPKVTDKTTDEELFAVFESMLSHVDDGHTRIMAEINGEPRHADGEKSPTNTAVRKLFEAQDKVQEYDEFRAPIMAAVKAGLEEKILRGNGKKTANRLRWGRPADDIGYILIGGMGRFSEDEEASIEDELKVLHEGLDEILTSLADTKAIILDLSFNGGGMDLYSLAIASHFTDQRRLAFTKGPFDAPDVLHKVYVEPYAGSGDKKPVRYTKPIYAVSTDFTASAAEIFLLCMRSLPNAKVAGMKTEGALSDVLEKVLPNGWELGLSNEVYRDHKGVCFEEIGIPVDIELQILDASKPGLGHAASIQKLVEMIR